MASAIRYPFTQLKGVRGRYTNNYFLRDMNDHWVQILEILF